MQRAAIFVLSFGLGGCSLVFSGAEHRGQGAVDAGIDSGTPSGDAGRDAGAVDCASAADGTACAPGRVCAGGGCEPSTCGDSIADPRTEECDDGNDVDDDGCTGCQFDCETQDDCPDDNVCNGVEECNGAHQCVPGESPDEGTPCSGAGGDGVCRAGACVAASCGDGAIDAGEDCDDGANGDDADGCTDACLYTCTTAGDCDDGDLCNGVESCDADHMCTPGTPRNCDDGVACTTDACDADGGCAHALNHSSCEDGVACTDNTCTATGCTTSLNHSRCDDGVACTNDSCTATGCSNRTEDTRCSDGIACTVDRCSPTGCTATPDDSQCPVSGCGTRRCVPGSGCQPTGTSLPNCRLVSGRQVFRVPAGGPNGNSTCAAAGLVCSPIGPGTLGGTNTACLAFRPGTPAQVSPSSGFGGGVYCSGTTSGVCAGASNLCHECTACTPIDCGTGASTALLTEFYVECR